MSKVEELAAVARDLSPDALDELLRLARAWRGAADGQSACLPVALGGLWRGVEITDEDIREARREMWGEPA